MKILFLALSKAESLLPLFARAAFTSPACLKCYSGTYLWEEDINAGNGESARFDVYCMTFGVVWPQLRLHAKRMPLGSNVFVVLDKRQRL